MINKQATIYSVILLFSISILFNQNKLKFSADIAKSYKDGDIITKEFKDNVKIIDEDITLYANTAINYPDSNKVILMGDVRMYENSDSLTCKELWLYKGDNERYEAIGDVILFKQNKEIKANNLTYYKNNNIEAVNNISIKDSTKLIMGDTLFINYNNSLLNNIEINSNAKLLNTRNIQLSKYKNKKKLQDKMESSNMFIQFKPDETIEFIDLSGMAIADFSVVKDSMLKGHNNISGDTISIYYNNEILDLMTIKGGAIGEFIPDETNSSISDKINYEAEDVKYYLNKDLTILNENAKVIYGQTILEGGKIEANWDLNIVESRRKDDILPSVSTNGEEPTYGEYMIFDLLTEQGNIEHGYNQVDIGIFKGDQFLTDKNEDVYIDKSIFTSCDLETPHYHFGSKKMKVIKENNQIVTRPMILFIQDFPAFTLPFAILPNSTEKRKSGFIMPSFGHSSTLGTWIEDFGYYFAPNDYYDILTYLDFYDKKRVKLDSYTRYKKHYGEHWYNYKISGYFNIKNYIKELIEPENDIINFNNPIENPYQDFTNLDSDSRILSTENYSVQFEHKQDFDISQFIRINYEYYNFEDISSIVENDLSVRLDQKEESRLFYSKNWDYSSITIGMNIERDLVLPDPTSINTTYDYKRVSEPNLTYRYNNPLIFGNGDKWFHKTKFSYNSKFYNNFTTFTKEAELNEEDECCVWSINDMSTKITPGAIHNATFKLPFNLSALNIIPNFSISEKWAISENYNQILARKINGSGALNISTKLYGIMPLSKVNSNTLRHVATINVNSSYTSKTELLSGNFDDFSQTYSAIKGQTDDSRKYTSLSLKNLFQIKTINENQEYVKRDILTYNLSTGYNWGTKLFNPLISSLGFKNKRGGEYLRINIEQSFYINDESNQLINFSNGDFPRLTKLSTTLSRNFRYNISGESFNDNDTLDINSSSAVLGERDSRNKKLQKAKTPNPNYENNNKAKSDSIFHPTNISSYEKLNRKNKVWDLSFGLTLTAKYNLVDKWDLEYSKLLLNSNIYLTENWSINNNFHVDLTTMNIDHYEIEFKRSLHCWDFLFFMKLIGYNKGFGLRINISEPSLQSIRMTQSSIPGRSW